MDDSFETTIEKTKPLLEETQSEVFMVDDLELKEKEIENHPYQEIVKRRAEILEIKSKTIDDFLEKLEDRENIKIIIENFLTNISETPKTNYDLFKKICNNEDLQIITDIILPLIVNEQPHFDISKFKTHTIEQAIENEDTDMLLQKQRKVVENLLSDSNEVLDFVMQAEKYDSNNIDVQDNIKAKYIDSIESSHEKTLDERIGVLKRRSKTLLDTFESYSESIQLLDEKITLCENEVKKYESQIQNTTIEVFLKTLKERLNQLNQNRDTISAEFDNTKKERELLVQGIEKLNNEKYSIIEVDFGNKKHEYDELRKKSQEHEIQEKMTNMEDLFLSLLQKDLTKGII